MAGGEKSQVQSHEDVKQEIKKIIQQSVYGCPVFDREEDVDTEIDEDNDDDVIYYMTDKSPPPEILEEETQSTTVTAAGTSFASTSQQQWNVLSPRSLRRMKINSIGSNSELQFINEHPMSRPEDTTQLLHSRDRLVQLQIKCFEQKYEINEMKKMNILLEKQKLLLEIELLKKTKKDE